MSHYTILLNQVPQIDPTAFIAAGVQLMGGLSIGKDASIWYNTVLRADIATITIGERTNIQDGAVVHVDHNQPTVIGNDVTIGHNANIHACTIEDGCLIGIGASILSGAVIKKGSIIAAGSVIRENQVVEPHSLMMGVPAILKKDLGPESFDRNVAHAGNYVALAKAHNTVW